MRLALISAIGVIALSSSAFAADMYSRGSFKDGRGDYVPAFSWTGFYIGAHVGYGWGEYDISSDDGGFDETPGGISYDTDGVLAGVQLGYNWQRDNFVVGIEADVGYLGAEGDKTVLDSPDNFGDTSFDAYGVIAGRLGIVADRSLFYVKGGWAVARVETDAGDIIDNSDNKDESDRTSLDDTLSGYAVGGGVEYAFAPNWTLKAEYLYLDFEDESSGNDDGDRFEHETDMHTVKVGVNYRFGDHSSPLK